MSSTFVPASQHDAAEVALESERAAAAGFWTPRTLLASAFVTLVVAAVVAWYAGGKYYFVAKRFGVVVPGEIYRSGQISKWVQQDQWTKYGIRAVIDMNGVDPADLHQQHEIELVKTLGVEHRRFPLAGDGTGDVTRYADAIEAIVGFQKAGKPVLVHCSAGAQRTGGAVAYYRVLIQGWDTEDAVREMEKYAFRRNRDVRLIPYLNANIDRLAALLVERGLLEKVPSPMPRFNP